MGTCERHGVEQVREVDEAPRSVAGRGGCLGAGANMSAARGTQFCGCLSHVHTAGLARSSAERACDARRWRGATGPTSSSSSCEMDGRERPAVWANERGNSRGGGRASLEATAQRTDRLPRPQHGSLEQGQVGVYAKRTRRRWPHRTCSAADPRNSERTCHEHAHPCDAARAITDEEPITAHVRLGAECRARRGVAIDPGLQPRRHALPRIANASRCAPHRDDKAAHGGPGCSAHSAGGGTEGQSWLRDTHR